MGTADIVFLITSFATGGAEHQVRDIAVRLAERGWSVAIVSMIPPRLEVQQNEQRTFPITHLGMQPGSVDVRAIPRLARVLDHLRPRLVHSHMIHANLMARLARPISQMPSLVCTSHNVNEEGRLRDLSIRVTDRLADRTTHVSRAGFRSYLSSRWVSPERAMWLPNGVDLNRFRPMNEMMETRKTLGIPTGHFVWLAVGLFRPQKAFDRLVRAFARLEEDAVLMIAGDGQMRAETEIAAEHLGVRDRTLFLGERSDIPALMNAADAFVLSSDWEGLPMVLLEAASCALPIVTPDVGGCSDVVEHSVNGMLVEAQDDDALLAAMHRMIQLPVHTREAMGRAGRRSVEERFDIERIVGQWEQLYRQLISQEFHRVPG